jgi:hypothetical protein
MGTLTLRILKDNISDYKIDTTYKLIRYLEKCAEQIGFSYHETKDDKRSPCGTEFCYRGHAYIMHGKKIIAKYNFFHDEMSSSNSWELLNRGVELESERTKSLEIRRSFSSVNSIQDEMLRKYVAAFYDGL